ncbi:phosphoesterase [Testudinibacter aquarius]|nr:phosphoesterase [Testudinibacter aquarius]
MVLNESYKILPTPQPGFRVLPYLQAPASNSITINWVSELNNIGKITLTNTENQQTTSLKSSPLYLKLMEYSTKELEQVLEYKSGNGETETLEQGSWLLSNNNYKHSVQFNNLEPNTLYRYTVSQDGKNYSNEFKTYPTNKNWQKITLIAFSDTETEPYGKLEHREWEIHTVNPYRAGSEPRPEQNSAFDKKYGNRSRNGMFLVRYPLNQQRALNENLRIIQQAKPAALLIAGDLTQGSGYQPAWDEFFRHFAGEFSDFASHTPLLTALGNWETYAALNDGYGNADNPLPPVISRNKYHDYFDTPGDKKNPQFKDSYYRTDIGPITLLTLDSTKGIPDENTEQKIFSGKVYTGNDSVLKPHLWSAQNTESDEYITTDTQGSFSKAYYDNAFSQLYPGKMPSESDIPGFNPGTAQWQWVEEQLKDARQNGQIILVQFHHAPYSSGIHGTPPNHQYSDNQSGVAMRVFIPLFEKYDVAAVIAGHDEMFERSWVDSDGDGKGIHIYDVGVAADGLRGEKMIKTDDGKFIPLSYNTYSRWSATKHEPEYWKTNKNGVKHLIDGGLHYGHLHIELNKTVQGSHMRLTPVYIFPILDDDYELIKMERREYNDIIDIHFNDKGNILL